MKFSDDNVGDIDKIMYDATQYNSFVLADRDSRVFFVDMIVAQYNV